jgi:hypothetical protein
MTLVTVSGHHQRRRTWGDEMDARQKVLQADLKERIEACKVLFTEVRGPLPAELSKRIVHEVTDVGRSGLRSGEVLVAAARHRLSGVLPSPSTRSNGLRGRAPDL